MRKRARITKIWCQVYQHLSERSGDHAVGPAKADASSKLQVSGFPNLHPFPGRFLEAFVDVPLEICEQRDPKQLYAKARAGQISDFTGISSPYEAPESPEITLSNHELSPAASAAQVVAALNQANILTPPSPN